MTTAHDGHARRRDRPRRRRPDHDARRQGPRRPAGRQVGHATTPTRSWSTRTTSASSRSSSSAPGWPARRRRRRSPSSATRSTRSRSTTRRGGPTRSPPRAASTRRRTTAATATAIYRLFYDTIKGGDFRAREGNVYRLAQVSVNIIDQMVAQGVPFAREYGGLLDNRSFGGAQVSRTFYARGQTGQQLLLGAYQQMARQVGLGNVRLWNRMELVDIVVVDGRCAGIVTRDLLTGEVSSHAAHAVVLCTGGYGNAFFLSTNAMACNVTAAWRAHRKGAYFANPCYTQIHPTCIPQADDFQSKLTLMSESLRNDGRVWVPKNAGDERPPDADPRGRARLLPRAALPELRQPRAARHLVARRQAGRRLRPRRRPAEERRVPRLRRRHRPPRRGRRRGALREPVRDVRADHRREPVRRCRCASTRRRTTRWAGCGSTTS